MTEVTNPHEQLECAARAAGYLGEYNDDTGEREWFGPGDGSDWDPRENVEDAFPLISILGLMVDISLTGGTAVVVIGVDHNVENWCIWEDFSAHDGNKDKALMMAITRAAAEIGRCMA